MEKILHSIKAYLYANLLTDDPNDYVARVKSEQSLTIPQICESAVSRGGADISPASMQHGVELFLKEMAYQLCDGFSVNTGYFKASPLIKGVFSSPAENFKPEKHSVMFQFNQGETLRKTLENIEVQIMGIAERSIFVSRVTDIKSNSINHLLTPNRNLAIEGSRLKIVGESENNGIFFVNQATGERSRVDISDIVVNKPSKLIIVVPPLAAGNYVLEITTQYSGGGVLVKESQTIVFDNELMVLE